MKKILFLTLGLILSIGINITNGKNLQAYLSTTTFYSPTDGPYIETYMSVFGNSIIFTKKDNGKFQGTIEVIMIFRKDKKIEDFAKYELLSPEVDDTTNINFNFIDQQRFALPNGTYEFELIISDKNKEGKPFNITEPIIINYPPDKISVSGIELIESYTKTSNPNILTKSGYDFIPYITNFYPENISKLTFYSEVYNTEIFFGENHKFIISYFIQSFETSKKLPDFTKIKRENAKPVNIIFNEFDISRLPSGNYQLVIEVRDKENNIVAFNKLFFQRSNPNIQFDISDITALSIENSFASKITNKDTLKEYIRSLSPISSQIERTYASKQLMSSDLQTMQQYFLNFWLSRDNTNPEQAWINYLVEVNKVNAAYKTPIKKGYDTDRGRVYLKYGPPNIITESYNEPSAYPYEIWHYYILGDGQRNKKFVFYTLDIVTNDFVLLHSDAFGELSNYRWQVDLHRRDFDPSNLDITKPPDAWGNKANDYYNIPR